MTQALVRYLEGLNPEQAAAVSAPKASAVQVLAGAGTGKTELISRRFAKLTDELVTAELVAPTERILVVTFTEKASLSMQARIQRQLGLMGLPELSPDAWVGTFHQCCQRILQTHALEAGLAPGFTVLDAPRQRLLFHRLMGEIRRNRFADIADVLAAYALTDISPQVLSTASLHRLRLENLSALLRQLPHVIARIKATGLSPAQFLQAARSETLRLSDTLKNLPTGYPYSGEPFEHIREQCQAWREALRPWADASWDPVGELERDNPEPKQSEYKEAMAFLADPYLKYDRSKKRYLPVSPDFTAFDAVTDAEAALVEIIAAVYAVYEETLRRQNLCDFDNLINHTIALLAGRPDIRADYRQWFEAIIVDEFQDSNGSQLELLRLLMRDTANITVVGDVKQSIYGFRYAQPENMNLIFEGHPLQAIHLRTNYRSLPPVLEAANHLTRAITPDAEQQLLPSDDNRLRPAPPVTWITLGVPQEKATAKGEMRWVEEPMGVLRAREARLIAAEIQRLVSQGARFSDIAVLVKTHDKAERIHQALRAAGIPAVRQKNLGFFDEPVIRNALALMQLMLNPQDETALVRLLQQKLSQFQLLQLANFRHLTKLTLFQTLEQIEQDLHFPEFPEAVHQGLFSLVTELKAARDLRHRISPVRLFRHLGETIGFLEDDAPEALLEQQVADLRTLERLLESLGLEAGGCPDLPAVMSMLEEYKADPDFELPVVTENLNTNAVQLMTIYAAKGLEFPVVFIAAADSALTAAGGQSQLIIDPQFEGKAGFGVILGQYQQEPTLKKETYQAIWVKPRAREEQKRLFYVALTRARQKLYVIRARQSDPWTEAPVLRSSETFEILVEAENPSAVQQRCQGEASAAAETQVEPAGPEAPQQLSLL